MMEYVSAFIGLIVVMVVTTAVVIPITMNVINTTTNMSMATCTDMRALDTDSRITDRAGVLSSSERTSLAAFIADTYTSKCIDVGILIVNDTKGVDLFSYSTAAFDMAGLGGKNDSGLLMTIDTSSRKYFVETGYGLESCMPDGKIGTAAREKMLYPILDDFAGRTGGGGQGGAMKASGYGVPITETLRTLTDGCNGNPANSNENTLAPAMKTVLSFLPIFIATAVLLMVVSMLGDPRG